MIDAEEVINKIKDDKYYTYEELTVVLNYIDKLKEKSKKCEYYEMVAAELYKNSISKDKIKEKIEELFEEMEELDSLDEDDNEEKRTLTDIIEILQELLEE